MECIYCLNLGAYFSCCHCGGTYCSNCSIDYLISEEKIPGKLTHPDLMECIQVMSLRIKKLQDRDLLSSKFQATSKHKRHQKTLE